jgi:lipoate-protein ligase A
MHFLDLTLPSPAENLALDEALLESAVAGEGGAVLRVWESPAPFVVLGLGGRAADDVDAAACAADGVPVLRRASGGGTVLQGPGCLSYALVLPVAAEPALASIAGTNTYVLTRVAAALAAFAPGVAPQGTSDLAVAGRKVSGNAQRRKKAWVLFHGTLLYGFDAGRAARYLTLPPRRPAYRADRAHADFLANLPASAQALKAALRMAWSAHEPLAAWPQERTALLARELAAR